MEVKGILASGLPESGETAAPILVPAYDIVGEGFWVNDAALFTSRIGAPSGRHPDARKDAS